MAGWPTPIGTKHQASALATELGSVKQALHLEREASRNQAKKVEQLLAVEARAAVLEAQVTLSAAKSAIVLEERLAKLDKAVFGGEPTGRLNAQSGSE